MLDPQHSVIKVFGTEEADFPYLVQTPLMQNKDTFRAVNFSIHLLRLMLVNIKLCSFSEIFFLFITALFKTEVVAILTIPTLCQYIDNNYVNAFTLLLLIV